jgi:hypothetical protein
MELGQFHLTRQGCGAHVHHIPFTILVKVITLNVEEIIGCPTYKSGWNVLEFHIYVNLPNFVWKKQEDKGSFFFFLSHVFYTV